MAPTSSKLPGVLVLAFAGAIGMATACFDSDEVGGAAEAEAADEVVNETIAPTDEEGDTDDSWDPDTGAGDSTCRDAINCLVQCQIQLSMNNDPEPDLSCFIECDPGLTTDEAYALLKLGECIAMECAAQGACAGQGRARARDRPSRSRGRARRR